MNILITGGTGFIGTKLCESLQSRGHHLTVLSRRPDSVPTLCGEKVVAVSSLDKLSETDKFEAIINLAGENIADGRWTENRKQALKNSRIQITEQLLAFIAKAEHKPDILVSGSAVGFYGNQKDKELDETSKPVDDFAHQICAEWEQTALKAEQSGVRVCIIRTGLVIGDHGGFLQRMLLPFKNGFGGRLGNGKQWMSWIHRDDLVRIVGLFLINPKMRGIYNGTSPTPVTNQEFTKTLAKVLKRPALIPVPGSVLTFLFGEMSELILGGQKVLPKRLLEHNFVFKYETLEAALKEVLVEDEKQLS